MCIGRETTHIFLANPMSRAKVWAGFPLSKPRFELHSWSRTRMVGFSRRGSFSQHVRTTSLIALLVAESWKWSNTDCWRSIHSPQFGSVLPSPFPRMPVSSRYSPMTQITRALLKITKRTRMVAVGPPRQTNRKNQQTLHSVPKCPRQSHPPGGPPSVLGTSPSELCHVQVGVVQGPNNVILGGRLIGGRGRDWHVGLCCLLWCLGWFVFLYAIKVEPFI